MTLVFVALIVTLDNVVIREKVVKIQNVSIWSLCLIGPIKYSIKLCCHAEITAILSPLKLEI